MKINVIQFKISLNGIKPPVWRRIQVQDNIDFMDLHLVIQEAMGWRDIYMFGFEVGDYYINSELEENSWANKKIILEPNVSLLRLTQEERQQYYRKYQEYKSREKLFISNFINKEKQKIKYTYNFKYVWDHTIIVEKILIPEKGINYPVCIGGKRACPPDSINIDVRGAVDYMIICDELKENSENKKYDYFKKEFKDLYKRDFDPEYFNLNEINQNLESLHLESIHGTIEESK